VNTLSLHDALPIWLTSKLIFEMGIIVNIIPE
jgi:hypothetical protein